MSESEVSMSEREMQKYWTEFLKVLAKQGGLPPDGPFSANRIATRTPQLKSWMTFGAGRTGIKLCSVIDRTNARIRAEIYLSGKDAGELFQMFKEKRDSIERELGFRLEWLGKPERKDGKNYRIAIHKEKVNPENRMDWSNQHAWIAEHLCKMRPVVEKYADKFRG